MPEFHATISPSLPSSLIVRCIPSLQAAILRDTAQFTVDLSTAFLSAAEQSIMAGSPAEGMLVITAPFSGAYYGTFEYVYNLTYVLPPGAKARNVWPCLNLCIPHVTPFRTAVLPLQLRVECVTDIYELLLAHAEPAEEPDYHASGDGQPLQLCRLQWSSAAPTSGSCRHPQAPHLWRRAGAHASAVPAPPGTGCCA